VLSDIITIINITFETENLKYIANGILMPGNSRFITVVELIGLLLTSHIHGVLAAASFS